MAKPINYMTVKDLLVRVSESGLKLSYRKLRYWQQCGLIPRPTLLPGHGHIGYYTDTDLARVIMVARSRRSHRELRKLDRRPTREVIAVLNGGIPEVLEIVEYQDLPDGRQMCVLRDGSVLVRKVD